jgi:hypothetical protein
MEDQELAKVVAVLQVVNRIKLLGLVSILKDMVFYNVVSLVRNLGV